MDAERWNKLGFVLFTKEYCAGTIAGIGVGALLAQLPQGHQEPYLSIPAWFCMAWGGIWARAIQKKRLEENKEKKEVRFSN